MQKTLLKNFKLIITIVKKSSARKAVQASKTAGAEGGTTLQGKGAAIHENESFWGMTIMPEREMIMTLVCDENYEEVLNTMCQCCNLQKPRHGLALAINVTGVTGIFHKCQDLSSNEGEERMDTMEKNTSKHDLIVTIVNKGSSEAAVEASKKAGARGGTILFGRGTGIHEKVKLLGITIEPEKEVLLTLVDKNITGQVLDAIVESVELHKPGKGIAFILNVDKVTGISEIEQLKDCL